MERGYPRFRLEDLAERFEVSRTPAREALVDLSAVGLIEVVRYQGYASTFRGPGDIAERAEILAAACAASSRSPEGTNIGTRLSRVVGGHWGETQWAVISAWPRNARRWGQDPAPLDQRLLPLKEQLLSATTAVEAAAALRAIGDTASSHHKSFVVGR